MNTLRLAMGMLWSGCVACACSGVAEAALDSDSTVTNGRAAVADSELAASRAPPWNPSSPAPAAEPWERAIRLPLRVATFPLSVLDGGLEWTFRYVEESNLVPRLERLSGAPHGLSLTPASLGDRTGLGGAIRYRPPPLHDALAAEISESVRHYTRARLEATYGPAQLAYAYDWRPSERFFDYGLASSNDLASTYAVRKQSYRLGLAYPWAKRGEKPPRNQLRAWAGPRESILKSGREGPSFDLAFPHTAAQLGLRREDFVYGAGASLDTRSGVPHWGRGFRLATQAERFDRSIGALSIGDARAAAPQFTRMSVEGEAGVSFMRDPRTIRLAIRAVNQAVDSDEPPLLLSDLMSLGGNAGLAGFEPGRFHDMDLLVGKLSYIFPLTLNLELDLHAESGGVYSRLVDARLRSFKSSYGIALRPRLDTAPLGSIGIDWSAETMRLRYSIGGVE
jgi:hypothetical protein